MDATHFGLNTSPFSSKIGSEGAFVGPRQSDAIASLQKGLVAQDAIVCVTGPVGVGKTTLLNRALETLSPGRVAAWISRMPLTREEVLAVVLAGFGIQRKSGSPIQRFAAFRRLIHERAASGVPVAIIVEDAPRLGAKSLAELEALTAADGIDAGGANLVLMGDESLRAILDESETARLKQRIRRRIAVEALNEAEVRGYLSHRIRSAGGNYGELVGDGVAEFLCACSGGIPRVINMLCECALSAAEDNGDRQITVALIHEVARDSIGYDGPPPAIETSAAVAEAEPVEVTEAPDTGPQDKEAPDAKPDRTTASDAGGDAIPESARNIVVESGRYPEADVPAPAAPEPPVEPADGGDRESAASAEADDTADDDDRFGTDEIPHLINDTQPGIEALDEPTASDSPSAIEQALAVDPGETARHEALDVVSGAVPGKSAAIDSEAAQDTDDDTDADEFDLDAVLSPEAESTNILPAVTGNLDDMAANSEPASREETAAIPVAPDDAPIAADATSGGTVAAMPDFDETGNDAVDDLPTLSDSMRVTRPDAGESDDDPAPEAESGESPAAPPRDARREAVDAPSMKEPAAGGGLRGDDIDALEAAIHAAKQGDAAAELPTHAGDAPGNGEPATELPEITLDQTMTEEQQRRREQQNQIEIELSQVHSLEEINDMMAETLFGDESFEQIAAEAVANGPDAGTAAAANGEMSPVRLDDDALSDTIADDDGDPAAAGKAPGDAKPALGGEELRDSVALRIGVLNDMKASAQPKAEKIVMGEDPDHPVPPHSGPQPEPIERQINTSMTQTLEAINVAKAADKTAAEKSGKKPGGLFSRFRRSS